MEQAPCQQDDPERWFIDEPASHAREVAEVAALCRGRCPLAQQVRCARRALEGGANHGTWAGVTLPGTSTCKNPSSPPLRSVCG